MFCLLGDYKQRCLISTIFGNLSSHTHTSATEKVAASPAPPPAGDWGVEEDTAEEEEEEEAETNFQDSIAPAGVRTNTMVVVAMCLICGGSSEKVALVKL